MNIPEVSGTMEPEELHRKLTSAVTTLATLYDAIGKVPYSVMSNPELDELRKYHGRAERLISELTADDIPF